MKAKVAHGERVSLRYMEQGVREPFDVAGEEAAPVSYDGFAVLYGSSTSVEILDVSPWRSDGAMERRR